MRENKTEKKARAKKVVDVLKENYPEDMRKRHNNSPNGHLSREEHMEWQKALFKKGLF